MSINFTSSINFAQRYNNVSSKSNKQTPKDVTEPNTVKSSNIQFQGKRVILMPMENDHIDTTDDRDSNKKPTQEETIQQFVDSVVEKFSIYCQQIKTSEASRKEKAQELAKTPEVSEVEEVKASINSIHEEASEIYERMKKTAQEVTDICNQIKQGDYKGNAKLDDTDSSCEMLDEYDETGKRTRRTCFLDGEPNYVIEYEDDKKENSLSYSLDGLPSSFHTLNYKKIPDGWKNNVWFEFNTFYKDRIGELSYYEKGSNKLPDGSDKIGVRLDLRDEYRRVYQEGIVESPDGSKKADVEFVKYAGCTGWEKVEK